MTAQEVRARLSQTWRHGHAVDLQGLHLDEPLDLSGLALCGVDFRGARFAGLRAHGAQFDGLCWFHGAQFDGPVDFSGTRFASDARFDGARFATANFHAAEFRGIAGFHAARLARADMTAMIAYGNADFGNVRIESSADFSGSEFLGGFWAEGADLPPDADLGGTEVHGRLWIKQALRGNTPLRTADFGLVFGYTYS